jgi:lipopolysaccharide biosynthesis glycosyltransferase
VKAIKGKICLATVCSQSFIPGTLVMIHSFLKHNRWFKESGGEILIIHDHLPQEFKQLFKIFNGVKWIQVGEGLKKRVDDLCREVPGLKLDPKKKRFYSLALFNLQDYEKVLFCDSDILFLHTVGELIMNPEDMGIDNSRIIAGGDLFYFTHQAIDKETFLPGPGEAGPGEKRELIKETFNAGFLLVSQQFLTQSHYNGLLDCLHPDIWRKVKAPRTDQVVLNRYFNGRCKILSAGYNYLVLHADVIPNRERIRVEEIKVLHFNGKAKPWEALKVIQALPRLPGLARFVALWQREYQDFLAKVHLTTHLKGRGQ